MQGDFLLLLGLLLGTAAPDDADEEEEEENSHRQCHGNERPSGYWCNEVDRRVKTKQKHAECIYIPLLVLQHYKVAFGGLDPKILKRPSARKLQVETMPDTGNKDLSWAGVGLLCSMPGHGGLHTPLEKRIWKGGEEGMKPGTEAGPLG